MALTWTAKAPAEVVERRWTVPVPSGDSLASYTLSPTGITIDSDEADGADVVVTLSAGTDGATAIITATALTTGGLTLVETIYLPITAKTNAFSATAQDVVAFALRKVVGIGETPEAAELDDGLEHLNDMLAEWAGIGADVGVPLPMVSTDTFYTSDAYLSAIKNNLKMRVLDTYGEPIPPMLAFSARAGLQQIRQAKLPSDREGADFY
jgi:hypothetical protein